MEALKLEQLQKAARASCGTHRYLKVTGLEFPNRSYMEPCVFDWKALMEIDPTGSFRVHAVLAVPSLGPYFC